MGGMVLETNMTEIITRIEEQNKLEKQEVCTLKARSDFTRGGNFLYPCLLSVLVGFLSFFFLSFQSAYDKIWYKMVFGDLNCPIE